MAHGRVSQKNPRHQPPEGGVYEHSAADPRAQPRVHAVGTAPAPASPPPPPPADAQRAPPPAQPQQAPQTPTFKPEELDQLVAPIALHPDPLLAQILMASTYPLEVVEAARFSKENAKLSSDQLAQALQSKTW